MPPASMSMAEFLSAVVIWPFVAAGFADLMSAAIAAAVGAAADVPQNWRKPAVDVLPQSPAVMSTLGSDVPPFVANMMFPGVMAVVPVTLKLTSNVEV